VAGRLLPDLWKTVLLSHMGAGSHGRCWHNSKGENSEKKKWSVRKAIKIYHVSIPRHLFYLYFSGSRGISSSGLGGTSFESTGGRSS